MREIKYKAWDKKNKKWTLPLVVTSGRITLIEPYEYRKDTKGELVDVEVVEYTGLKDKNGKEIWEGDILEHTNDDILSTNCGIKKIGRIYFENGAFLLEVDVIPWRKNPKGKMGVFLCQYNKNSEVIGNIYENSELLKEQPK